MHELEIVAGLEVGGEGGECHEDGGFSPGFWGALVLGWYGRGVTDWANVMQCTHHRRLGLQMDPVDLPWTWRLF